MDEIQVDPKLFVTCRLCLEDFGQYQIVPTVQHQIKYCFDIEVEPFDGLPQLICVKCKNVLNKYYTVKNTFCEKQVNLRINLVNKDVGKEVTESSDQPQQDTVSSSQQSPEIIEPHQPTNQITNELFNSKKKKSKRKRLILQSSSSSDSESEQSFQTSKPKKNKPSRRRDKSLSPTQWEDYNKNNYKKFISCQLCSSVWSSRTALAVHNRGHELLREKYKNIFNRQCTVNLIKIDDKPNITGLSNMVVHNSNKIVAPGDSYFYTIYLKEDITGANNYKSDLQTENGNQCFTQESSDGEEGIGSKPTRRKTRLTSRSSNETVVIESNSNKLLSDDEDTKSTVLNSIDGPLTSDHCINIDDSSDSESVPGTLEKSGKVKQPIEAKFSDYKIIQGIISMCVNSYHKKNELAEVDMLYMNVNQNKKKDNVQISNESQLIHKVLSIGRKTINKQGFNCTGLLRYMEHKNLEIAWIPRAQLLHPKDTNYIRILTKLRDDQNLDDESGWVNVSEVLQQKSSNAVPLKNSVKIAVGKKSLSNVLVSNDSTAANIETSMPPNIETSQPAQINNQAVLAGLPATLLYVEGKASASDSRKLLNANPVANPKKLPKKLGVSIESKANKAVAQQSLGHTTNNTTTTTDNDINFCLPIITSTTSLATIPIVERVKDANNTNSGTSAEINKTEATVPRIKVKPASELMSERTLDIMKETTTVTNSNMLSHFWPNPQPIRSFVPNIAQQILVPTTQLQILQMPTLNANTAYQPGPVPMTSNTKPEYVILDTTDFPNTKTESPVQYVKNLMQLHNMFLLDPYETLTTNFICLIKYKVVFKQDHKDSPVILCLSLSCYKNTFSFQIRDRNDEIIDMSKLTANWQWEILQTYRGEVSNKVLENARKFGQETYDLTNHFFCLFKAISCRKPAEALKPF